MHLLIRTTLSSQLGIVNAPFLQTSATIRRDTIFNSGTLFKRSTLFLIFFSERAYINISYDSLHNVIRCFWGTKRELTIITSCCLVLLLVVLLIVLVVRIPNYSMYNGAIFESTKFCFVSPKGFKFF